MRRFVKKTSYKAGFPPGTLVHIGEKKTETVRISYLDYDYSNIHENVVDSIEECFPLKDTHTVSWINIDGIHRVDIIEKIGKQFDIHPLVLEDILHTNQRPKIEDFGNYMYIVLKMIYSNENNEINSEQISLIMGENFVISFQEIEGDTFEPVRKRIRSEKSRIRKMGPDYLTYALIDSIVDNYFIILEKIEDKLDLIEDEVVSSPTPDVLRNIHSLKWEMTYLRKSVWPLREVINSMTRTESNLIQESTRIYLRDLYDHTIQVIDTVETFRDILSGMLDVYLSSINNKMSEVMKFLTIIATIFIPLTFIAGVYGMNFEYMPELEWKWGYHLILSLMFLTVLTMVVYFKKKKWF
ncbi:magnesium and cobalt transport protein CorA [Methanosalsum zhilinae DSM 4017]|uniref:Magnesium transport protein CorA n=1 Tax=Methanosalsum zhilinae (strain DSM 4017 / NBRC 107636 / OCM 62 / WeN5) TaxID=679901 RepID=F7XNH7_METZD|nr:magnesium/cobalt transporter CorA [Methanosalsum zhilinae]AEH61234.1 magnesium and cobalt transport protein CorA [Methanosalsum zhilinae DSM 4017]